MWCNFSKWNLDSPENRIPKTKLDANDTEIEKTDKSF